MGVLVFSPTDGQMIKTSWPKSTSASVKSRTWIEQPSSPNSGMSMSEQRKPIFIDVPFFSLKSLGHAVHLRRQSISHLQRDGHRCDASHLHSSRRHLPPGLARCSLLLDSRW